MIEISPSTRRLLALSFLKGVGPMSLRKLSMLPGFTDVSIEALAECVPSAGKAIREAGAWTRAVELAEKQVAAARDLGARILSPLDQEYPPLLSTTSDDPFILYVLGELAPKPKKSVAIIGTREPTAHGTLICQRLTSFFVEHNWSVVSGLAIGCDALAHQEAIDRGGHTVAVLAHGLQTIAPTRHRKLADHILASGGALVSQYPIGTDPRPQQFVQRDRTQAGMSQGVVMVQSDLKGGSLHASRAALSYNRWLAAPVPTLRDRDAGEPKVQANIVLTEGAPNQQMELLRCSAQDLVRVISLRGREDYARMTSMESPVDFASTATQGSLF